MSQLNITVGDYVKVTRHLKGAHEDGANHVMPAGTEGIVVKGGGRGWCVVDFGRDWGERCVSARHLEFIGIAYRVTAIEEAYDLASGGVS